MNLTRFFKKGLATGVVAAVLVSACDFEVTNPGPVQDENLNAEATFQGLLNGAIRSTQDGFGTYQLLGGALTHDIMATKTVFSLQKRDIVHRTRDDESSYVAPRRPEM